MRWRYLAYIWDMPTHYQFYLVLVFLFYTGGVNGQSNKVWSFSADLNILLNKGGAILFGDEYIFDFDRSNPAFGIAVQRRHYPLKRSHFSYEYGLRLQRSFIGLTGGDVMDSRTQDLNLDRFGASIPLRVFYGGKGDFTAVNKRQSGLFAEVLLSGDTGNDLVQNVYAAHASLGARTRGKRLYYQISFGWPVFATETVFTFDDRALAFTNRERRFTAVTIGYQLQN